MQTLTKGAGLLVFAFGCWTVLICPFAIDVTFSAVSVLSLWCVMLFTAAISNEVPPRWILMAAIVSLVTFAAGSWLVFYGIPPLGQEVQDIGGGVEIIRFGGLQHPNGLGRQCALGIAMMLVAGLERFARWKSLALPMAFVVFTGAETDSRTAILWHGALFLVAFCRTLPLRKTLICLAFVGPLVVAIGGLALTTGVVDFKVERMAAKLSRDGDSAEVYSMNSRTLVWDYAWRKFAASPLVGYGQGCQRFVMRDNFFPTHHAHNLWLNVALGTGLFGAGLLLWQTLVLGRRFFVAWDPFSGLLLVTVLIFGMTDSVMLGPIPDSHTLLWWLALLCPAGLAKLPGARADFLQEPR